MKTLHYCSVLYCCFILLFVLFYWFLQNWESFYLRDTHTGHVSSLHSNMWFYLFLRRHHQKYKPQQGGVTMCSSVVSVWSESIICSTEWISLFLIFLFFFHCDTEDCKRPSRAVEHLLKKKTAATTTTTTTTTTTLVIPFQCTWDIIGEINARMSHIEEKQKLCRWWLKKKI